MSSWVRQRYVLAAMLFMAVINIYTMRVCLSVAIVQMVRYGGSTGASSNSSSPVDDPERCAPRLESLPASTASTALIPHQAEFDWSPALQGVVLSSFYYGYVITHLPGGVFADRFGGKHALGLGLLVTSVTTLLSPVAARLGVGYLIVLRVLMGLGEGVTFPAISALLSKWVPPGERSFVCAFVLAGNQLGIVISNAGSGLLLQRYSWPSAFYLFGVLGLVWYILWSLLCSSSPEDHPFISASERAYLAQQLKQVDRGGGRVRTPWRGILASRPVWGLIAIQIGHDWGFFTLLTDLPKYMSSVLQVNIATNGVLSSLPYLSMWLTAMVSGAAADWLVARKCLSVLNIRRLFTSVASLACALGVIGASYAGCDADAVVALLVVGLGGMGCSFAGMRVNALDLSRHHAGTVMALVNGAGAVSGVVSPLLIGLLTPDETMAEWRLTFWIVFAMLVVTNSIYVLLARADVQPWDRIEDDAPFPLNSREPAPLAGPITARC